MEMSNSIDIQQKGREKRTELQTTIGTLATCHKNPTLLVIE